MKVTVKGSFDRDIDKLSSRELRLTLDAKITQIEKARDASHITGLKLLDGYTHHYRILVKTGKLTYRIGAIIRGENIWLYQC
ncbi:MAG TPA: hypothetical protein VI757_05360 [Bacteroidia bacterium]|nr:hypothetical protein [Bacteroidia bacterium]